MSSATSTDPQALQPWQLFTLAGLVGATIVVFLARGQSPAAVILLSLTIFAAAGVGVAALRTIGPLTGATRVDRDPPVGGGRTRAALEREKAMVLRSIKEIEFDRAMGKMSEKDFAEMSARLRARAARLIRQLDAGAGYRQAIEREIEQRLAKQGKTEPAGGQVAAAAAQAGAVTEPCRACQTRNDPDARFCKGCGARLEERA